MKKGVIGIVGFAAGAALGSAVTYLFMKQQREKYVQKEIDIFMNDANNSKENKESSADDFHQVSEEPEEYVFVEETTQTPIDYNEFSKYLNDESQDYIEKEEDDDMDLINNPDVLHERPYVISPDEFGEYVAYEPQSLMYYADGVLTDDMDNPIEDIDGMVGEDFAEHFGEYEDDSVYIRNDKTKCDYEILASAKTFAEATQKYANVANQKWDED